MTNLHVDFETRSAVDLKKTGVYVYAADRTTDVWCMAYAFDGEAVNIWRNGEPVPPRVKKHILDGGVLTAHNAQFERAIWKYVMTPRYGWPEPRVDQWRCTMAMAYAMALPGALEHVGPALNTGFSKDMAGARVMMSMARPRAPKKGETTKPDVNGLLWRDDPESKQRLYTYCKADVEAEMAADARLVRLRPGEQRLWALDQVINDRGIPVDANLCRRSLAIVEAHARTLDKRMKAVTDYNVSGCTNVQQLKTWLNGRGVDTEALDREAIVEMLIRPDLDPQSRSALLLRQEAGKASVAKINALLNGMNADGRARGLLQFHAANTGRWGGRRFQPQNIKRPDEGADIPGIIDVVLTQPTAEAIDTLDTFHGSPLDCIANTLRGMVAAPKGRKIVASDFSNIEGRVLAWLAGEHSKLDAFRAFDAGTGEDLYKITAADVLRILGLAVKPAKDVTKSERQVYGKVSELALGFGGGKGAFLVMAHGLGLKIEAESAEQIKVAWRDVNPNIVQFWYDLEESALRAIKSPGRTFECGPVRFRVAGSFLWCQLPSGRALCYPYPAAVWLPTPWGQQKEMVTFKAVPNVSNLRKIVPDPSNTSKWARISTYGGSLAENVTQAVARDLLAEAIVRLEDANYQVILTVHDEAVSEVAEGFGSAEEYDEIMTELPAWAKGLPVAASGFEDVRYRK